MRLVNRRDESETQGCQAFSCRFLSGRGFIGLNLQSQRLSTEHHVGFSMAFMRYYGLRDTNILYVHAILLNTCKLLQRFFVDVLLQEASIDSLLQKQANQRVTSVLLHVWQLSGCHICRKAPSKVPRAKQMVLHLHAFDIVEYMTVTMCCILRII